MSPSVIEAGGLRFVSDGAFRVTRREPFAVKIGGWRTPIIERAFRQFLVSDYGASRGRRTTLFASIKFYALACITPGFWSVMLFADSMKYTLVLSSGRDGLIVVATPPASPN